jgi:hypothetical protein
MFANGKMMPVETIPGKGGWQGRMMNGDEFKYDTFYILKKLLWMLQCTPTQHNNKKNFKNSIANVKKIVSNICYQT